MDSTDAQTRFTTSLKSWAVLNSVSQETNLLCLSVVTVAFLKFYFCEEGEEEEYRLGLALRGRQVSGNHMGSEHLARWGTAVTCMWKADAGGSRIQDHPHLLTELVARLWITTSWKTMSTKCWAKRGTRSRGQNDRSADAAVCFPLTIRQLPPGVVLATRGARREDHMSPTVSCQSRQHSETHAYP